MKAVHVVAPLSGVTYLINDFQELHYNNCHDEICVHTLHVENLNPFNICL